jgi:hypothetical protein
VIVAVADTTKAFAQRYETYCLPQAQLKLGGLELLADSQEVRKKLGRPLRLLRDSSEDDGGKYSVLHLIYPHLQVDIGRDHVERLATKSTVFGLPAGVRVEMSIEEVGRRLELANPAQYLTGDTLMPVTCRGARHSADFARVSFIFGSPSMTGERQLVQLVLTEYGP